MKMKLTQLITLLCCTLFIMACGNKKPDNEQEIKEINNAYTNIDNLDEKIATDSNYKKSSNYGAEFERAQIELAKKTKGLDSNEKLLLEYEMALKNLKTFTEKSKLNNDLLKDKGFASVIELKANRVREFQQELKKQKLTPEQLNRFNELSTQ